MKLFGMCACGHIEEEYDRRGCVAEDCRCVSFEPAEEEEEESGEPNRREVADAQRE